jgi:hypothetical protein
MLAVEFEEEQLIVQSEEAGTPVLRRMEAAPAAVLGLIAEAV